MAATTGLAASVAIRHKTTTKEGKLQDGRVFLRFIDRNDKKTMRDFPVVDAPAGRVLYAILKEMGMQVWLMQATSREDASLILDAGPAPKLDNDHELRTG